MRGNYADWVYLNNSYRTPGFVGAMRWAGDILKFPAMVGEAAIGGYSKLGAALGVMDQAHLSKGLWDFRAQNLPLFQAYISQVKNVFEVLKEKPYLPLPVAAQLAGLRTKQDAEGGFQWVKDNPGPSRDLVHLVTDPTMWGMLGPSRATVQAAKEIEALLPHVEGFRLAVARTGMTDAASDLALHGAKLAAAPVASPQMVDGLRAVIQAGATDREVAEVLHLAGARDKASLGSMLWGKVPEFFKSGSELFVDQASDVQRLSEWQRAAYKKAHGIALANVPDFSKGELRYMQEVLHHVERQPQDLLGSFRDNYQKAIKDGVAILDEAGKPTGARWYAKPVDEGFFGRIESVAKDLEDGLRIGQSERSPIPRNPSYGPSRKYAERVNAGDVDGALQALEQDKTTYPGWRLPQKHQGAIEGLKDFKNWVAHVKLRETKLSVEEGLEALVKDRLQVLDAAIAKARPGLVEKEVARLKDEATALRSQLGEAGKVTLDARAELSRNIRDLQKAEKWRLAGLEGHKTELESGIKQAEERLRSFGPAQTLPVEEGPLVSKSGRPISAQLRRADNTILLNPEQIAKDFAEKAWTKPKVEGVAPLPADAFKTVDEWRAFLIEHESVHARFPQGTLSAGEYEQAVNERAMAFLERSSNPEAAAARLKSLGDQHRALLDPELPTSIPNIQQRLAQAESAGKSAADIQGLRGQLIAARGRLRDIGFKLEEYAKPAQPGLMQGAAQTNPELLAQAERDLALLRQSHKETVAAIAESKREVSAIGTRAARDFRDSWARGAETARQNLQAKLDHVEGRLHDLTGNPDAIFKEAVERFNDPTPAEQSLFNARTSLRQAFQDYKAMKEDPDLLKQLAGKKGVGRFVLDLWDKSNRGILRLLTTYNPVVWGHETVGKHLYRVAMETGDISMKGVARAIRNGEVAHFYDGLGNPMKVMTHSNDALFDPAVRSHGLLRSLQVGIEGRLNALDELYQLKVKSAHYDRAFTRLTRGGMAKEQAHALADTYAEGQLDRLMKFYRSKSSAQRTLERVKMVPAHVMNYMHFWGGHAAARPAEALQVAKAYGLYKQYSLDGKGMYRLPGTEVAVDPFRLTEVGKFHNRMAELPRVLSDPEKREYQEWRLGNIFFGEDHHLANAVLAKAGLAEQSAARPLGFADEAVALFSSALGNSDWSPSSPLWHALGTDPEETQAFRDKRTMALYNGANLLARSEVLPPEEQVKALQLNKAVSRVGMLTTGLPAMYAPAGVETALGRMRNYSDAIAAAEGDPAVQEKIYQMSLADPDMQPVLGALRRSPATRFGARQQALQDDYKNVPVELRPRAEALDDILQHSKLGIFMEFVNKLVGKAGATELADGTKYDNKSPEDILRAAKAAKPDLSTEGPGYNQLPNGRLVPKPSSRPHDNLLNAANDIAYDSVKADLRRATGAQDLKQILDSKASGGQNRVLDVLRTRAASGDSEAQGRLSMYEHAGDQSQPIIGEVPSEIAANHRRISVAMKDAVLHGDPSTAAFLVNGDPKKVAEAYRSGQVPRAFGVKETAYDPTAIKLAQEDAANLLGLGQKNWEKTVQQKYPETDVWRQRLTEATRADYPAVAPISDLIGQAISEGKVAPSFWKDLRTTNPELYANTAVLTHWKEVEGTQSLLARMGDSGRFYGVDPGRLADMVEHGAAPYVSALLRYGSPQIKQAILSAGEFIDRTLQQPSGTFIREHAPNDLVTMHEAFGVPMDIRAGVESHAFDRIDFFGEGATPPGYTKAQPTIMEGVRAALQGSDTRQLPLMLQGNPMGSARFEIPAPTGSPITVADRPYQSTPEMLRAFATSYQDARNYALERGLPVPEPGTIGMGNLTYQVPTVGFDGKQQVDAAGQPVFHSEIQPMVLRDASAVATLGNITSRLAGSNEGSRAFSGLGTAISSYGALATLGVATGGVGIGVALAVSAGLGIATGMMDGGGGGSAQAESLRIQQERLDLQREQFAEQQRQQSIRDLSNRERTLAQAIQGGAKVNRESVEPHLQTFQRRPTFASRLGLIDAVERELGSALKPRW